MCKLLVVSQVTSRSPSYPTSRLPALSAVYRHKGLNSMMVAELNGNMESNPVLPRILRKPGKESQDLG